MAPMTRSGSPGGVPGPLMRGWYRRRAENGVGLIMTEGVRIPHFASNTDLSVPCLYGEEALAQWDLIRSEVQAAGGKIMPQLWHVGLMLSPEQVSDTHEMQSIAARQCGPSGIGGRHARGAAACAEPMTVRTSRLSSRRTARGRERPRARLRRRGRSWRPRLPDRPVPVGEDQPARRPVRRDPREAVQLCCRGRGRDPAPHGSGLSDLAALLPVEGPRLHRQARPGSAGSSNVCCDRSSMPASACSTAHFDGSGSQSSRARTSTWPAGPRRSRTADDGGRVDQPEL